ncbi:flagellar protein FlhE [Modicisalibacter radicis]|uniref:flagellar protein FlhE n=1 Tax=Halomonas sp. EAR18 TaxID=2518972 RepID=UPI00109C23B8|nr:flagellar protein FlhE [Halomonas sp. EAR18]
MNARLAARCALRGLAGAALASALFPAWAGAAGSWVDEAPSVRLFTPGREVVSQPFKPPAPLASGEVTSISWRFEPPPGAPRLEARLCHPQRCQRLLAPRGKSDFLAGLSAAGPFVLRFRLPEATRPSAPLRVEGLQLIVNYR